LMRSFRARARPSNWSATRLARFSWCSASCISRTCTSSTGSAAVAATANASSATAPSLLPSVEYWIEMKPTSKSDETRARILEAAMDLFRRKGFEETTMREIAAGAGMAIGAAYYYFDSKDAIVLAFYDQAQAEMIPQLEGALAKSKDLKERLRALLEIKLRYFEPNRRLLGALAVHTDPEHSLSPFSERTRAIRERDVEFFARALEGSKVRLPADLKQHLPR